MLSIEPTGAVLGATLHGLDLAQPLADADFATLLRALGEHGVLRIPGQRIEARDLRDFWQRFGSARVPSPAGCTTGGAGGRHPLQCRGEWRADRHRRCRAGLAHGHVAHGDQELVNVLYAVKVPIGRQAAG